MKAGVFILLLSVIWQRDTASPTSYPRLVPCSAVDGWAITLTVGGADVLAAREAGDGEHHDSDCVWSEAGKPCNPTC